jgi:hypothetical protein
MCKGKVGGKFDDSLLVRSVGKLQGWKQTTALRRVFESVGVFQGNRGKGKVES